LFDGKDLNGWQGPTNEPPDKHWSVEGGEIRFDGRGDNIWCGREYNNFELLVDLQDSVRDGSGICMPGRGRVQLDKESGPLPKGGWDHFHIVQVADKVHVFLNGKLLLNNVSPTQLIHQMDLFGPSTGPIGLHTHGQRLRFKNIYLRDLSPP
jgi:hypothetical protein